MRQNYEIKLIYLSFNIRNFLTIFFHLFDGFVCLKQNYFYICKENLHMSHSKLKK